jgi:hypothetical protein
VGRCGASRFAVGASTATTQLQRTAVAPPFVAAAVGLRRGLASSATATHTATHMTAPLVNGGAAAQRQVFYWLAGCTGWVFSMVVLGGVTRLTRSGLSMTGDRTTHSPPRAHLTGVCDSVASYDLLSVAAPLLG